MQIRAFNEAFDLLVVICYYSYIALRKSPPRFDDQNGLAASIIAAESAF
jgi:hypothetical protein